MARLREQGGTAAEPPAWLERFVLHDWCDPEQDPPPPPWIRHPAPGTLPVETLQERLSGYHSMGAFRRWSDACSVWRA